MSENLKGIEKIDYELAQHPDGASALRAWMLYASSIRAPAFMRGWPQATRANAALGRILDAGTDPDHVSAHTTALCVCAMKGNLHGMRKLLDAGASLGFVASSTALLTAVTHMRDDAARLALDKGSDPNDINAAGHTPAQMALFTGNFTMLEELFARGATINPLSSEDAHPLAKVVEMWGDENLPPRAREKYMERLIELPGCDLNLDAPCTGQSAIGAIEQAAPAQAARMISRVQKNFLARRVSASPSLYSAARRM